MNYRILRRQQVEAMTGLARSTLYDLMAADQFPRPIRLGKRAVGWRERDICDWLEGRPQAA